MQTSLIITILGADRAGLVESISKAVKNNHGNWQDSRMVKMSGQFAGLARISISADQIEKLSQELLALQGDNLQILIKQSGNEDKAAVRETLSFELLGPDRSGIVHDITKQLTALNVNIEKLESEQRTAPMSNEVLFYAEITLGLPEGVTTEDVQDAFEKVSDSLMVDVSFSA
ncbi:MAG TPA: ACT domain protein [Leucothrix mucor]|nr:ACT domain protein [Leucothrix mucor]